MLNSSAPHWRARSIHFWMRLVVGGLISYAAVVALLLFFEDRLLFHPVTSTHHWIEHTHAFQDVDLSTASGTSIHARWFPSTGADGAALICHSRAGNLSLELRPNEIAAWHQNGFSVFIFDYPGYGRSGGTPSEVGCYAAAEAAYDWLTRDQRVQPCRVLIYGRSLGTAVAVDLASRRDHRGLVLVSPFPSIPEVVEARFPLLPARFLMRNRFASDTKIDRCSRPVIVVHGTRDSEVPFHLGKRLYDRATALRRFVTVPDAHHGDCVRPDLFAEIRLFVASASQ